MHYLARVKRKEKLSDFAEPVWRHGHICPIKANVKCFSTVCFFTHWSFVKQFRNKNVGYASVRPFLYVDHFNICGLFCTSTSLLPPLYLDSCTSTSLLRLASFDLCASTFCQIWIYYLSRSIGRSTVLVEVKFRSK